MVCPEYEFIGGLRGEPFEMIEGEYSGLPIPANAENRHRRRRAFR